MSSIMFNPGATIAWNSLRAVNSEIADVQMTLLTGRSVRDSDDNPAAWAVAKVLEADIAAYRTVDKTLALGHSTIEISRQATETITDLLTQARQMAVSATTANVDRDKIQTGIEEISAQISSIVSLTQFNGVTLLENTGTTDGGRAYDIVASIERSRTGVAASTISINRYDMQIGVASYGSGTGFSQVNGIAGTVSDGQTAAVARIVASHATRANAMRAGDAFGLDTSQTSWGAVAGFSQDVTVGAQDRETVGEFSNRVAQRLTLLAAQEGMEGLLFSYDGGAGVIQLTNDTGAAITFGADSFGQTDITGAAGSEVVIEEFMEGEEASYFILCDGEDALPIGTAQDHKRVGEGDEGPNTGGMGAYSPAPVLTDAIAERAMEEIIRPTLAEMAKRGTPYQGVLYAGFMIKDGQARLVEYNCRFGDPECQVLMMRLGGQALDLMQAAAEGRLAGACVNWAEDHAITVVMAANGYPGDYQKGSEIKGLAALPEDSMNMVFHAGTKAEGDKILANGGRVLNVTARGESLTEARDRAYAMVDQIDWPEGFVRRDIGWRAL